MPSLMPVKVPVRAVLGLSRKGKSMEYFTVWNISLDSTNELFLFQAVGSRFELTREPRASSESGRAGWSAGGSMMLISKVN